MLTIRPVNDVLGREFLDKEWLMALPSWPGEQESIIILLIWIKTISLYHRQVLIYAVVAVIIFMDLRVSKKQGGLVCFCFVGLKSPTFSHLRTTPIYFPESFISLNSGIRCYKCHTDVKETTPGPSLLRMWQLVSSHRGYHSASIHTSFFLSLLQI